MFKSKSKYLLNLNVNFKQDGGANIHNTSDEDLDYYSFIGIKPDIMTGGSINYIESGSSYDKNIFITGNNIQINQCGDPFEIIDNTTYDNKCAPGKVFSHGSCIRLPILVDMARSYNKEFPNNQIEIDETLNEELLKQYLVKEFENRIKNECDNQQTCWKREKFTKNMESSLKDELYNYTFRPDGPQGQFTWLNTSNIDQTMRQYQVSHPEFHFMGTVPIDFDDLPYYNIKKFNFKNLIDKGIHKIGMIYNLDEHYKSGSHWVAFYSDFKTGECNFFDSYGHSPDRRIDTFIKRVGKFIKSYSGRDPIYNIAKTRHQRGGSECGVYSMSFILRLLHGESFESIDNARVDDKKINICRNSYFVLNDNLKEKLSK